MKGNEQVRRLTFCLMVVHRYDHSFPLRYKAPKDYET